MKNSLREQTRSKTKPHYTKQRRRLKHKWWFPIKLRLRRYMRLYGYGAAYTLSKVIGCHASQIHRYTCPICEHDAEPSYSTAREIISFLNNPKMKKKLKAKAAKAKNKEQAFLQALQKHKPLTIEQRRDRAAEDLRKMIFLTIRANASIFEDRLVDLVKELQRGKIKVILPLDSYKPKRVSATEFKLDERPLRLASCNRCNWTGKRTTRPLICPQCKRNGSVEFDTDL